MGFLIEDLDEYELVIKLRVTKLKARSLLYLLALRNDMSAEDIDEDLRKLLSQPRVIKEGDMVLIEVPQPLLMDMLRHRIRRLGFISDGSFSGSVARIPTPALSALIEDLIPAEKRSEITAVLRQQGIKGNDLQSLIAGAVGQFGKKIAGAAGERVAEQIGEKLGDFFVCGACSTFEWVVSNLNNSKASLVSGHKND